MFKIYFNKRHTERCKAMDDATGLLEDELNVGYATVNSTGSHNTFCVLVGIEKRLHPLRIKGTNFVMNFVKLFHQK